MLFTPATVPLFAKQAADKHVLAVHTSAIEQLKHATDTDMRPLSSLCIAYTYRLIHQKCTRRCHAFMPCLFFFLVVVINWSFFFSISKIFGRRIFVTNINSARLIFFSVKRWQAATRKIVPYPFARYQSAHQNGYSCLSLKKKKKKRIVSKSHRIYPVNPVKSNGTAQMHPGRWYTVLDCSSISYFFHCSCMKKARARKGSMCS